MTTAARRCRKAACARHSRDRPHAAAPPLVGDLPREGPPPEGEVARQGRALHAGHVVEEPAQLAGAVVGRQRQAGDLAHAWRDWRQAREPPGIAAILPGDRVGERPSARAAPGHDGGALGGEAGGDGHRLVARIAGVLHGGAQGAKQFLCVLLDAIFPAASGRDRHVGVGDFGARVVEEHGAAGVAALVERQDEAVASAHHCRRLSA